MMRARIAALALVLVASAASAADDAFFRRCEVARRAALVGADVAALQALLADGAQYVHTNGAVDSKPKLIERIASGEIRYRTIVVDEESYACHATGCEVSGAQTLGVSAGTRELTLRNHFTATWVKQGGACKLVAYQSSPPPK